MTEPPAHSNTTSDGKQQRFIVRILQNKELVAANAAARVQDAI